MKALLEVSNSLNPLAQLIEEVADEEERTFLRTGLAEMACDLQLKLLRPVLRQYPDLGLYPAPASKGRSKVRWRRASLERGTAESLMKASLALGERINPLAELIEEIADEEERRSFRKGWAEIACDLYIDMMVPIIRNYPDLDPNR